MSDRQHDLVIRGGTVYDGTGAPAVAADVAVAGDRVAFVGAVRARGAVELDARGQAVAPGFIDVHSHDDFAVLLDPGMAFKVMQGYGCFPRVLGHYVREEKLLGLEEAIRKMTSLPAARLSLNDRGSVKPGMWADLVLFDPATVTAKTPRYAYDLPCNGRRLVSESEGIKATFVAGVQLYEEGKHTGAMPGRILRSRG
jgi:N-acyl-D-aspartate/D-glutamate deacylase